MKTKQAVKVYGSEVAVARLLGVSRQAVNKWNGIIPLKRALTLERLSGGRLKLHLSDYR